MFSGFRHVTSPILRHNESSARGEALRVNPNSVRVFPPSSALRVTRPPRVQRGLYQRHEPLNKHRGEGR